MEITFIGNEGVILSGDGQQVAIDALFADGASQYATTAPDVIDAIDNARPPFDQIDVLLATHHHYDHFNAKSVGRHLLCNRNASLITTPQAHELLYRHFTEYGAVKSRVTSASPEGVERQTFRFDGTSVEAFHISHGQVNYGDVQHLGFVVRMGGQSALHLGDAMINERTLRQVGILEEDIDVAFVPFWYLTYEFGRRLMRRAFRPRRIFAVHTPPDQAEALGEGIEAAFPNAVVLRTPMATYTIENS